MKNYKNEELVNMAKFAAQDMEERILGGEVIKDEIRDDGDRILVTKTSTGRYGYAVFSEGEDKPHYLVEGQVLLQDLNKHTAHNGVNLRYPGAKSMIQRNMVGQFAEYIKDPGFESFYIAIQMPKGATMNVSQQMSGYYSEDPVDIFGATFSDNKVWYASYAQLIPDSRTGKPTLRIGTVSLNPDGMPDYDTVMKNANDAEDVKRVFGERYMSEDELLLTAQKGVETAQSVFYNMYNEIGLPMNEGIMPCNLLTDAMNGNDISHYIGQNGFEVPKIDGPKI